jgi:mono/diheme cytochrome c family protein
MKAPLLVATMAVGVVLAACSARRGEPLYGPLRIKSPAIANGQQVFMRECHQCHPGGEGGLGPAINNKPLPGFLIAFQVRQGFGAMPAFSQAEITPEELDNVIIFLKEIR